MADDGRTLTTIDHLEPLAPVSKKHADKPKTEAMTESTALSCTALLEHKSSTSCSKTSKKNNKKSRNKSAEIIKSGSADAIPDQTAVTVASELVEEVVCRFGAPAYVHSDQGRQFEGIVYKEMCKLLGNKKTRTMPYHPQSNRMVERYNKTLA